MYIFPKYIIFFLRIFILANSADPDETPCHLMWHLIWVFTICHRTPLGVSIPQMFNHGFKSKTITTIFLLEFDDRSMQILFHWDSSFEHPKQMFKLMGKKYLQFCAPKLVYLNLYHITWVKVFRINPEFWILRLTFHRKSASKCWIRQIIIASLFSFQIIRTWLII